MINLAIDTTTLRNDPARKKAAFRSLRRLAEAGELKLHIPYIVVGEFISQQIEQYVAGLSEIATKAARFSRKHLPPGTREIFVGIDRELNGLKEELGIFARTDFRQWVAEIGAEIHPVAEFHGQKVVDAYFSGAVPFREKKRRDDIPDAFIWQVVLDLVQQFGQLFVISNDGAVQTACEAHPNITVFGTLEEFVASDICQAPLRKSRAKSNFERLISIAPEIVHLIESIIESETAAALDGKTINSQQIPDDNNEATIVSSGDATGIEVLISDAEYFGDGLLVVPVTFLVECLVNYAIFKSDFYILPDDKAEQISVDELNDHYYDAVEDYTLSVMGFVAVDIGPVVLESEDVSDEQLLELVEEMEISLDSVEEIEVPSENNC